VAGYNDNDMSADTITALATPPGRGGIGVIRISGPLCPAIAQHIVKKPLQARHAEYLPFFQPDGSVIDMGIALYFPAPHSFTGENVLELQGHGGPVVMDMLLKTIVDLGARPARPGEFSQRAFLNDKLDLAQAEAIADLIDSASQQAARLALRSLQGEFSRRVEELVNKLTQLRMYVEAAIDFPEEEIDFLHDEQISTQLQLLLQAVKATLDSAIQGCLMREGMSVVIAGKPNAGKSTLLNQLTGRETAIVTEIPGTTRDVLREQIHLDGMPVHIIDTAGLRESADRVEQEGIRRAWHEIEQADRILYLIDHQQKLSAEDQQFLEKLSRAGPGLTIVHNKIDITDTPPAVHNAASQCEIYLSAKQGRGMELLRDHLKACVGFQAAGEGAFMARRRHVQALQLALAHIESGANQLLAGAGELLAEDLRQAQQHLSEITGEFTSDDLLGKIFSSFCIGK
jgi:tRNA modification GTPase